MQPFGCGLFLLFVAFVAFLGWAVYQTAKSLYIHRAGVLWWFLFSTTLLAGTGFGFWCAFYTDYQPNENTRLCSAPVPAAVLKLEGGQWIDYISPVTPFIAVLNWLTVCFGSVMPVSFAYLLSRWAGRGLTNVPGDKGVVVLW
jgi:hypothetical protein